MTYRRERVRSGRGTAAACGSLSGVTMADSRKDRRRYSDREMALILRRAADLQAHGADAVRQEQSHTLAEVEQLAVEVGIDPRYVAEAAQAVDAEPTVKSAPVLGAPTGYQIGRVIAGEVSEAEFADVLDAIRRTTGKRGEVSRVLGSLEWRSVSVKGESFVTVSPREGKTAIRIGGQYGRGAVFVYGLVAGIGAALLVGASVSTGSPIDLGTLAAVGAGSYLAARTAWQAVAGRAERKLRKALEEVTLGVMRVVGPRSDRNA
ncbi:MAG: hypothetical protein JSW71_19645 [Gemmatimonadota bacterium]|nr:MAG: hypothetical protein JSW71_19645 [Gemmatimonadota bacterium]